MVEAAFSPTLGERVFADAVKVRPMAGRPSQALKNPPNRIREVRERAGMTLREVGRASGFSEQVLQRYETGENKIRVWQLERVAKAMGVAPHALINSYDAGADESERALLAIFRRLPVSEKQRAITVLAALEVHQARSAG